MGTNHRSPLLSPGWEVCFEYNNAWTWQEGCLLPQARLVLGKEGQRRGRPTFPVPDHLQEAKEGSPSLPHRLSGKLPGAKGAGLGRRIVVLGFWDACLVMPAMNLGNWVGCKIKVRQAASVHLQRMARIVWGSAH